MTNPLDGIHLHNSWPNPGSVTCQPSPKTIRMSNINLRISVKKFPPASNPPINYEELERIHQKENQEMMDMQKQIAIRLNQMAEILQKSICQQIQPQPQPPIPNPLSPQPLPNPKRIP
ncbi:hypothetical protein PIB30_048809 [Stylosanthes scabra]|uniref:Uncharacterized protein n=1 Tax=Stylosanthes scabra TaxID=79078 RepID=A0ABU6YEJ1_9FABA|nr:hypothetical protein [Stylosanthes scabra]